MMRRIFLFTVLLLACTAVSSFASGLAHAHALPDGVTVSFKPVKNNLSADDQVLIKLTYNNISAKEVRLLGYATGLSGSITEDILSIWFEGQELDYIGVHAKRLAPRDKDYVLISPGQSVSKTVDLQEAYAVEKAGIYRAVLRTDLPTEQNELVKLQVVVQIGVTLVLEQDIPLPQLSSVNASPSQYQFCTNSQATQIAGAVVEAERYARVAKDALSGAPLSQRPSARRYKEWFGAYDPGRWATVESNFSRIYSALSTKTLSFDCSCPNPPMGRTDIYAYVISNRHYEIFLCDVFWLVPLGGTDSKAGTIVHEVSHFSIVAGTGDSAYGHENTKILANSSPNAAIGNADSIEYFAENTPFLSMPTGTDEPGNPDPSPEPDPEPEPEPVIPSFLPVIYALLFSEEKAR